MSDNKALPEIICGPMVRRLTATDMVVWLATSTPVELTLQVWLGDNKATAQQPDFQISSQTSDACHCIQIGQKAFVRVMHLTFEHAIEDRTQLTYDLLVGDPEQAKGLNATLPDLLLPDAESPQIIYKQKIDNLLHGSCRKPHHASGDGLVRVDQMLTSEPIEKRPALLMMAGDQIYADDVAGPMLVAIHQIIDLLGLFPEQLNGALVSNSDDLFKHQYCYYQRVDLLPDEDANEQVDKSFFKGKKKPIFTSVNAQNHLITAAEVYAMYLLSWSPVLWQYVDLEQHNIGSQFLPQYQEELPLIESFKQDVIAVQRVFAHLPVYMIFDDHDVTDDWNLTRGWEQAAYDNPFSKRIIGNALLGYWLFQGLGNEPQRFSSIVEQQSQYFTANGMKKQDELIDILLDWSHWHYALNTEPKFIVLDTRTHRWRSEEGINHPSGLMDWESLTHLQNELYELDDVIIVSAAPIFGVKIIEAIQRVFTFFGKALMVDAENWMAHKGTAKVMLDTFLDARTPDNMTILSGDVHYSFVYDVKLRSFTRKQHTHVVQVTCSGIKNSFPDTLIRLMDRLNRWIYGRWSLFNFFTKRRRLSIRARHPKNRHPETLLNTSGIGRIEFDSDSKDVQVTIYSHDGSDTRFE